MQLYLYNTLSRTKEPFKPQSKKSVSLYSCGPTVYNYAHIGNLRNYIAVDLIRRTLEYNNFMVEHVMNITDVGHLTSNSDTGEDKLEKGARREKKSVWDIAVHYEKAFINDLKLLNIEQPSVWCRATDHIEEQIQLIQKLEEKGVTYSIDDGVYFDTSLIDDYGKLARLDTEQLKAGARVEYNTQKRNVTDFALWKFSPENSTREMEWASPWGVGFPGWHIECSAMAMKYLGETLDIHIGGVDHVPVHHTNEIAQSETATGKPFSNYWMHGEFLNIAGGDKMAKSGENFITLSLLVERKYDPLAFRYMMFLTHYRKQVEFSFDALDAAQNALKKLKEKAISLGNSGTEGCREFEEKFMHAINDDVNMPQAIAVVWDMLKSKEYPDAAKKHSLLRFDRVLGLELDKEKELIAIPDEIQKIIDQREQARAEKNWAASDALREQIESAGYTIEDTPKGAVIEKK